MHKYTFDVKLFTTLTVEAKNEGDARAMLRLYLDGNDANFGAWPNGDPILGSVSLDDGEDPLIDVDGEPV